MKVLFILNHAPDYREEFLRQLSKEVELTVLAQPCGPDRLTPPAERQGYRYIEAAPRTFMGFRRQPEVHTLIQSEDWEVICASANPRHISRVAAFLASRKRRRRWIWWGLIFGEHDNRLLHAVRRRIMAAAGGILVHSEQVRHRLSEEYHLEAVSYNNTSVRRDEFRRSAVPREQTRIHLLFVGTYKPRKKIERLIHFAEVFDDVDVRIVGPGMDVLSIPPELADTGRVTVHDRAVGTALNDHFDWAHIVVSPGNTGLLVIEAARHGKAIAVDNDSYHGPEVWAARVTGQPFLSFGDDAAVRQFLDSLQADPEVLSRWSEDLREEAIKHYTVEHMTAVHVAEFERVRRAAQEEEAEPPA